MRAELHKNQYMVAFVWGIEGIAHGRVCVYEYTYDQPRYVHDVQTYIADYARGYWQKLIKLGYRRQCSHMPCVPKSDYIPTHLLLNAFEDTR